MLVGVMSYAQSSVGALGKASDTAQQVFDHRLQVPTDTIIDVDSMEVQPEFPGGMVAMYDYLASKIHYPDEAFKEKVQGKVFVQFVVGSDGKVRDAKVRRGVRRDLDEEAVRAISAMPPWKPGKMNGKAVATRFTVPIDFKLKEKEGPSED